jgi:anti-sigma B factor antagonist
MPWTRLLGPGLPVPIGRTEPRPMNRTSQDDAFTIERHGEILLVGASRALENMDPGLVEAAADLILEPIRGNQSPLVVVDLSRVPNFGTPLLAVLLRCWKRILQAGGTMVFVGASPDIRHLLTITKLDTLWALYETRAEAVAALLAD